MFVRASAGLALALLLALPVSVRAQASGEGGVSLPIGSDAPSAALEDLEGNAVELATFVPRGKPAIIEFWATWCELCEALQPQLDRIQAMHGDDINVVAVAVGLFSGTLALLPRSGVWMVWVKRVAALIMIGMAEYYFVSAGYNL